MFDVWVMLIAGVVAFILSINRYPIAPLLMAFVLTPMFETAVRQSFDISNGDPAIFVRGPINITILTLIVLFIIAPLIVNYWIRNRKSVQNHKTVGK